VSSKEIVSRNSNMIVFRTDSSTEIGGGHISRCLTLANELRERGLHSVFACRMQTGDSSRLIEANGFAVLKLAAADVSDARAGVKNVNVESQWPEYEQERDAEQTIAAIDGLNGDATWIVADHYGLGTKWEQMIAPRCGAVLVIDDLANRRHQCDMLLDQNYYANFKRRYESLVPRNCRLFLGPRYVLLRPEFRSAKAAMRERDGTVRRILVSFGSSDPDGETIKALFALRMLKLQGITVDVVTGASNPRRDDLRNLCGEISGCNYHEQIDYMARLVSDADLALGAGGATTWERCVLGLPSLTIVTADNQLQTTLDTATAGAIVYLGRSRDLDADDIADAVNTAMTNPERNREMSRRASSLVPAVDGAQQLAHALSTSNTSTLFTNN